MTGFVGSATIQQNNGDNNAINAATALDGVSGDADGVLQEATAKSDTRDNGGIDKESRSLDRGSERGNRINRSFNGAAGVYTIQQNNGDNNAMSAATGVAGVSGNAGDLTQHAKANPFGNGAFGNKSADHWSKRSNRLGSRRGGDDGVFKGAHGVVTVQQNNGDNNAISAANAVAAHVGEAGNIHQGTGVAVGFSGAAGNNAADIGSERRNGIFDGSFNEATGASSRCSRTTATPTAWARPPRLPASLVTVAISTYAKNGMFLTGSGWNGIHKDIKDIDSDRVNRVEDAMNDVSGILTVQQNNGNANNIGAATGVIGVGGTSGDILQSITAGTGLSGSAYNGTRANDDDRENLIDPEFENFAGVVTVQQNNGDANSIVAGTGLVFVSGATGDTTQTISAWGESEDNDLDDDHGNRANTIDPSFTNATGILTVQQNNGSGNAMTALTGGVANQGGDDLDTTQNINAGGKVMDNWATDFDDDEPNRRNIITDSSFQNLEGIATVQQNNGDGNVISAATGVIANFGDGIMDDVVEQNVTTDGSVDNSFAEDGNDDDYGLRRNTLDNGVFNGSNGIVTVQQNNGSNNVLSAATGVRVEIGASAGTNPDPEEVSTRLAKTTGSVTDSAADAYNDYEGGYNDRHNLLTDSFKGGVNGVFTVQQNNGDNNVIGSAVGVIADINNNEDVDSALDNLARTEGTVSGNDGDIDDLDTGAYSEDTRRVNTLDGGAFDYAAGIITVQQNIGNNNVIGSATGVVANVDTTKRFGEVVTSAAEGDATIENNSAESYYVDRLNVIEDTMIGVQGIITVQQNNGDNNVMGAATNVVATTEMPGFGPATSTATLGATVSGNTSIVTGTLSQPWSNTVVDSFTGASGLMTVQQNNGNNNANQSAVSVVANGISFSFN